MQQEIENLVIQKDKTTQEYKQILNNFQELQKEKLD